ncbi:hypothetical protein PO124_09865 [Bacillus licheniformis]|nr:hypothetical protein [Bacillus licheniformis]
MDKRLNRLETDIDELKRGQERLPKRSSRTSDNLRRTLSNMPMIRRLP